MVRGMRDEGSSGKVSGEPWDRPTTRRTSRRFGTVFFRRTEGYRGRDQ